MCLKVHVMNKKTYFSFFFRLYKKYPPFKLCWFDPCVRLPEHGQGWADRGLLQHSPVPPHLHGPRTSCGQVSFDQIITKKLLWIEDLFLYLFFYYFVFLVYGSEFIAHTIPTPVEKVLAMTPLSGVIANFKCLGSRPIWYCSYLPVFDNYVFEFRFPLSKLLRNEKDLFSNS